MSDQNLPSLFRLRVRYIKHGRLAYLGHLEVLHTIERVIRRAALPYAVTQGFSPHMRVGFSSALPVGTSSTCEYYDVFLTELVPRAEALRRLVEASPSDLMTQECAYVDVRTPALTAQITRVGYKVELHRATGASFEADDIALGLSRIEGQGSIPYIRGKKSKVMDISRTLVGYQVDRGARACDFIVRLDTRCDNEGALRPEILLAALDRLIAGGELALEDDPIVSTGIQDLSSIESYRVERVFQMVEDDEGGLVDPMAARR